jgi:hypothetical protein
MQKLPEVPDSEPEQQDGDTSSELYSDDLVAQFKSRLGQLLRAGRPRKRSPRKQNDKSNGARRND